MTAARTSASRVEHAAMWVALFALAAGLPWEWTRIDTKGEVIGGDAPIALFFIAIGFFLALQLNGRWSGALRILEREPLLLLLLAWTALSFLWSDDPATTIRRTIALVITSYIGVHLVLRFTQFEILRMVASVLGTVVAANLAWILLLPQYSGPTRQVGESVDFDARLTGIFSHPNPLGRAMALAFFTLLAAYRLDRRRRPLYVAGILMAAAVLTLSQSKTAFVATIMTSLMLIIYLVFRARRTLFGAVVVSMVALGAGSIGLVLVNLGSITARLDRDITLTGRVPLWEGLLPRTLQRPLTGWGYEAYWNGWGTPAQSVWNDFPWLPTHGHNQFLDITLMLGFVGLALYTLLLLRTVVRATRYIRDVPYIFGLWPLTFTSFFLSATLTESDVYRRDISWALLVATIVLVSSKKRELPPSPEEATKAVRVEQPA